MSQYPTTSMLDVQLSDLSWLVGTWQGERNGQMVEEIWSAASGNCMMGMFRWMHEGRTRFYEFLTLEVEDQEIVMRLKHFYPGLRGWEDKNESFLFILVQLRENEAAFFKVGVPANLWMVYQRTGEESLKSFFVREGEGPLPADMFEYKRNCS